MNTYESLVAEAARLPQAEAAVADEIEVEAHGLGAALDRAMLASGRVEELVGEGNLEMMQDNHRNHFHYMASVLRLPDAESFVDTVLWVIRTYRAHGFAPGYWEAMLPAALTVLGERVSTEAIRAATPYYKWLLERFPALAECAESRETVWERMPPHGHGAQG